MDIEKTQRNVLTLRFPDVREGWEQWFLLSSDRHHDSRYSRLDLAKEHLEEARRRNAKVIDCGDFFDAMQGRYDPRRAYPDMQSKYLAEMLKTDRGYFDVILEDAARFYAPYADLFLLIAKGNHETAIEEHNDINLTQRLVALLNEKAGSSIETGYYGGYVRCQFRIGKTQGESRNIKYFHGMGGSSAPVTRGTIQTNRQAVIYPDADIVVNGHNHEAYTMIIPRERLSTNGRTYKDVQVHVRTPGYKDGWDDGAQGFDVEHSTPKAVGAVWLRFYYASHHIQTQVFADVR